MGDKIPAVGLGLFLGGLLVVVFGAKAPSLGFTRGWRFHGDSWSGYACSSGILSNVLVGRQPFHMAIQSPMAGGCNGGDVRENGGPYTRVMKVLFTKDSETPDEIANPTEVITLRGGRYAQVCPMWLSLGHLWPH